MRGLLLIAVAGLSLACTPRLPRDGEIVERFAGNKPWFEETIAFFEKEPRVKHLGSGGHVLFADNSERFDFHSLQAGLERADVSYVSRRPDGIYFVMATYGIVSSGLEKGILYAPMRKEGRGQRLDRWSYRDCDPCVSPLGEGWFLFVLVD